MATRQRRSRGDSAAPRSGGELDGTLKEIQKRYGANAVTSGSDIIQPERIPTGIFMHDFCTLGGIPASRATMVIGQKHAGKSVYASKAVAGAQRKFPDHKAAYIDVEGTSDPVWMEKLGVSLEDMLYVQPETGEAAVDMADALVGTAEVSLIVIDSIAALTPMKEVESSAEDALVGVQARLVGGMIRKVTSGMIKERMRGHFPTVLFVNQYRSKIGGWSPTGDPTSIPGGKALEYSTSLQLIMKNKENSGKDSGGRGLDVLVENEHAFTITKNKLNSGTRAGEFRLCRQDKEAYGLHEGDVDDLGTMLTFAKKFGVYDGGGSSWTLAFWDVEEKYRGLEDALVSIYADPDLRQKLYDYLIWENARMLGQRPEFLERFTAPHGIEIEYEE